MACVAVLFVVVLFIMEEEIVKQELSSLSSGNVNLHHSLQNDLVILMKSLATSMTLNKKIHFWASALECSKNLAHNGAYYLVCFDSLILETN